MTVLRASAPHVGGNGVEATMTVLRGSAPHVRGSGVEATMTVLRASGDTACWSHLLRYLDVSRHSFIQKT